MTRIAIIVGSTRPGRRSPDVAAWVHEHAARRDDAEFAIVDLADQDLPLLDEEVPPSQGHYSQEHTKAWARTIESFDGFVIVTPEYNHSAPAALKNALDFLFAEWADKAVGFVSYGGAGGVRAVEHLRGVAGELSLADVRQQVVLTLADDFENYGPFTPRDSAVQALDTLLDQVVAWSGALEPLRRKG